MAACPLCHSQIEITPQHHGTLFTCPHCSGVFFVDWSGQPENVDAAAAAAFEAVAPPPSGDFLEASPEEIPAFSSGPLTPEASSEMEAVESDMSAPPAPAKEKFEAKFDLSQVEEFGNADVSTTAFNYTVILKRVDGAQVRRQLHEALTDSRFGWDAAQLMSQIKDGVLTIRSVNPIKASILIQKVKYLPIEISWRQDVLSNLF